MDPQLPWPLAVLLSAATKQWLSQRQLRRRLRRARLKLAVKAWLAQAPEDRAADLAATEALILRLAQESLADQPVLR